MITITTTTTTTKKNIYIYIFVIFFLTANGKQGEMGSSHYTGK